MTGIESPGETFEQLPITLEQSPGTTGEILVLPHSIEFALERVHNQRINTRALDPGDGLDVICESFG